jgi:heterodisulfide reductase subunit C
MQWISQLLFILCLGTGIYFFWKSVSRIRRNILLGKDLDLTDRPKERLKQLIWVALGQSKMVTRPVAAFFHIIIYVGFVLINIEVLEILIDGIFGTHRFFSHFLGDVYNTAIAFFELLAFGVIVACVVFLARRYVLKLKRLNLPELKGWPIKDATIILYVEIILMLALLCMNASDQILQGRGILEKHGSFPVSYWLTGFFEVFSTQYLVVAERTFWWFHIIGILIFLNYVPYSKHWHIIMSFPNVYYSNLKSKGEFTNNTAITTEVNLMMNPSYQVEANYVPPTSFGAKDVTDLTWKNLMDAYSCTECGRCTSVCPANITGKLLSPRKIMMDTRDRLEEVGKSIDLAKKTGENTSDGKSLHSYISPEELWACTTCNACAEACPININPVDIIFQMRQYLVMEQSAAPSELNNMFTNLENNGAPWQFNPADKANWTMD